MFYPPAIGDGIWLTDKYIEEMLTKPCPNCSGKLARGEEHETKCNLHCACGCTVRLKSLTQPEVVLPIKSKEG
jgi:hypothetical protein